MQKHCRGAIKVKEAYESEQEGELMRRSNGDITSPGLSPGFSSQGIEVTMRHKGSKGKRHSSGFDRPNSIASISGCYKHSKYNSMTSLNSEVIDTQYINQEEIMQLTKDVRKFSESLTQLRDIFTDEEVRGDATIQVAAHERLRNLLSTLRVILHQYAALKSSEIHTAALHLIKQVKGMPANEEIKGKDAFLEALDQLALAFSNSVTEYLMGDVEQRLTGAKSFESLTSVGSTADHYLYGNHHISSSDKHQAVGDIGSMEDVDNLLMRLDTGVEISLERNKAWSKYAKDIIAYVQKRLHLELEFSRNLAKLAAQTQTTLKEESFLPFHSAYLSTLENDMEYSRNCEAAFTQLQGQKFVEQLESRRLEHDSKRKSIRHTWNSIKKEMHECHTNLGKARQLYYTRYQDYERAKATVAKSENEAMNTSSGSHSAKLDKKKKLEEDNLVKAQEAETTYKACIHEANAKQQELLKVKKEVLTQLKELVFQCDQTMKAVTYGYFQIHKSVSAPTPVQFQALCEQAKEYIPGIQFKEYLKHSMPVLSSHLNHDAEVFSFEPYVSEAADLRDRKQSTHSFDSVDEELRNMKRGNRLSNSHEIAKRTSAWVSGVSDSESISGSSTKSVEASPAGSPRGSRRGIKREQSGGTLSSGDEIADPEEPSPVVVDPAKLIDSMPNAFRNLTISKAAQTHVLRKLRTPSKCRECDSYVYFNGAECEKCGLASHKKCLEYLAIQCGGKRLQGKMNVFGVPLETHLRATGRSCPFIVTKCISEIESKAMNTKGIYRVAGLKGKVEKLCQTFENGAELVDLSETQAHLITSVLKLYFRQLPESLLQFSLFQEFVSAAKEFPASKDKEYDRETVIARFQQVTSKLPLANQKTASILMHHLKRVSEHESTNQMTSSNISIVFAPTLLRPSDDLASLSALMDINHQTRATELMVKYPEIFGPQVSQTSVETLRQDSTDAKEKVVSPNKSANNSSHLAASTSLSRGLASHTPPGRVSGFILPGSSEESDDVPHRGPPTNIPSVEMESDGRESSVGGDSDGEVTDDDDSEANDHLLPSSHAKSKRIPILGSRPGQVTTSHPEAADPRGSPLIDPKTGLSPMRSLEGYIPSAFSEVQPTRGRQGIFKDPPVGAPGPKRKTSKGQKNKSPNTQRRDREPKFV
ncbi:rho GTPase-activating protein 45-like isoform X3 [Apostichopus japonicus]|uniref:rho GTPase-activating protein 45-like isoform X3 n=1 Tax=Stichopus japonicus TaxID=307972 RepID=UPI003AB1495D